MDSMDKAKAKTHLSSLPITEFYSALGHTIKVARTDLAIDRKVLAGRAGISYSYLAAIESGKKQPSSQVLLAIAEALGLRTHELLESAEGRRERSLTTTEDYPAWLLGRDTDSGQSLFAMKAIEAAPPPEGPQADHDPFIADMMRLADSMSESDKQLLLDMAKKLADKE